jgi:hypothetical protein
VTVNWENYQKCDVCPAELGKPCVKLSGWHLASIVIEADEPHSTRKPRAGREAG